MKATDQITSTGAGRILLHAICMVRSPRHLACHWQGILRELRLSLPLTSRAWLAHNGRTACAIVTALTLLSVPVLCKSQSTSTTNLLANSVPDFSLVQGQPAGTNASTGGKTFTNRIHKTGVQTNASITATPQPADASSSEASLPLPPTGLRIIAVGRR
jgi:hypothetical protein